MKGNKRICSIPNFSLDNVGVQTLVWTSKRYFGRLPKSVQNLSTIYLTQFTLLSFRLKEKSFVQGFQDLSEPKNDRKAQCSV